MATTNWQKLEIGNIDWSVGDDFTSGSIAEVAFWSTALSDAEVAILAKGYSPLFVQPQNLFFYAPLIRDLIDYIEAQSFSNYINAPDISVHPSIIYPTSKQIRRFGSAAVATVVQDLIGSGIIPFAR